MQVKRGGGRGVLAMRDWRFPLRRPKALQVETSSIYCDFDSIKSPEIKYSGSWADCASENAGEFTPGQSLLVKYSYVANANSPLGQPELSIKQKQDVIFLSYCSENLLWSKVRSDDGEGYVPSNYIMALEDEVTSLPWLKSPDIPQEKVTYKPYKSAYAPKEEKPSESYRCDICCKEFNGSQPYNMHMKSKAHKEEVEAQSYY